MLVLAAVTLGTGLFFGLVPALAATRVDLFRSLRVGGERSGGVVGGRVRKALGAGLRSSPHHAGGPLSLLSQRPRSPVGGLRGDAPACGRPCGGAARAAVISNLPIDGGASGTSLYPEGTPAPEAGQEPWVINKQAQPGYFEAMGIRLVAGRDFREGDGAPGTPPVAVVNESFANRYWPGEGPLGKRIKYGGPDSNFPWMEVIGVASDVRHFGLEWPVELGIYEPFRQFPYWREFLVVRTEGDPLELAAAVRAQVHAVDPDAPAYAVRTMDRVLFETHWRPVILARVLWLMAALGLVLEVVGVYGVVAFSTALRRKEFGIRVALGVDRNTVLVESGKQAVLPCALGLTGGMAVGLVGMRLAAATMFGVDGLDPLVAAGAVAALAVAAGAATLVPARKASRLDPVRVLGSE